MFDLLPRTDAPPSDYASIFNERGAAYHQAMLECPDARRAEFEAIVALAEVREGMTVCDAPSGGAYLLRWLPRTTFVALETSETFHRFCEARGDCRAVLSPLHAIDLPDRSVDRVISLAGLHHLPDRRAFFREAFRILRPGGALAMADVGAGTDVDRFLNVFVDRHNSMGHVGTFLDDRVPAELARCGFAVDVHEALRYRWTFASDDAMTRFTTLMFGLDRAGGDDVADGIARYLGVERSPDGVAMNWGLTFVRATRPPRA